MARAPQDPKDIFEELTEDYRGLFGDELEGIILYGSAAGIGYRPGKSDINFMIILSEQGIGHLDRAFKTVAKWRKRYVAVPLFLTRAYVETSLDVFPIEYLGFQRRHIVVYGEDLLKDLVFEPGLVRLQCEREVKGKLLLLRHAFLRTEGKGHAMKEAISRSLQAFAAVFEALLFLRQEKIPAEPRELLALACRILGLDAGLFETLLDLKEERMKPDDIKLSHLFKNYVEEVRRLSKIVDTLGG